MSKKIDFNEEYINSCNIDFEEDDWFYILIMEYKDDNEGLSPAEFFKYHFEKYYPDSNIFETWDENLLIEYEDFLVKKFCDSLSLSYFRL